LQLQQSVTRELLATRFKLSTVVFACTIAASIPVTVLLALHPSLLHSGLEQRSSLTVTAGALIVALALAALQMCALMASQARSKQFIRAITDSVPVRLAYFDNQQRFQFVNQVLCDRFGKTHDAFIGRTLQEIAQNTRSVAVAQRMQEVLRGKPQSFEYCDHFDGRDCFIETHLLPHFGSRGEIRGVFGVGTDITRLKSVEQSLTRQTATLHTVLEAIPDMVAVWDRNARYRLVNRAFEDWRGERQDVIGRTIAEVDGAAEYEQRRPWIERALAGETVTCHQEYPLDEKVRHVSVTYLPLRLEDGTVDGFIGITQDITYHREESMRLTLLSERDALTGLLNRAGFDSYLNKHTFDGQGSALAVLYIDLDRFKPINDTYGHASGDAVLREFSQRLLSLTRHGDAVARLGGDEFGIVLRAVSDASHASKVADKVVEIARIPFQVAGESLTIGASVGVALNAEREGSWRGLVARADAMTYQAKSAGRDCSATEN
jgi:diguanylate cyclase (GGDEF)-like protein/PAS domain S-box-containing protein